MSKKSRFILGTSGAGKSAVAKMEIKKLVEDTDSSVTVIDCEGEYTALANLLEGEVIVVKPGKWEHGVLGLSNLKGLTVFDISYVDYKAKSLAISRVLDIVADKVKVNDKPTWLYIDSAESLASEDNEHLLAGKSWKTITENNGVITLLSQNLDDLVKSKEVSKALDKSDDVLLLKQDLLHSDLLKTHLHLSEDQAFEVTRTQVGCGIHKVDGKLVDYRCDLSDDKDFLRAVDTSIPL